MKGRDLMWRTAAIWALLNLATAGLPARADEKAVDGTLGLKFFEKKIRPILVEHCYSCHSDQARKLKGGLRVDGRDFLLKGGDSGPVVVPGHPEKSRLIEAISYQNPDLQMPPRGKLPDTAIADLTQWIRLGLPWPKEGEARAVTTDAGFDIERRKREHWAWQPIRVPSFPAVKDQGWVLDPVDAFILAKLEVQGLKPAPLADKRTWLRRVTFDLIGLPPSRDEIEAFLQDDSPQAYEKVVDRLLASPHYGERWARHWLDLVRYAESRGHEFDPIIPNAYQYRDYIIRAFNADVPYNQLVTEHLAGDLLDRPRCHPTQGFNESVLGTGFWLLGEEVHSPVDIRQDEADRFDNRIDVMTKTFLGLTVACARCHDHKFDAITQKDYYALFGFLASSTSRQVRFDSLEQNRAVAVELARLRDRARRQLGKALAEVTLSATDRLADYLLAGREILVEESGTRRDSSSDVHARDSKEALHKRVLEVATAHKLDAVRFEAWVAELRQAAGKANHPLHVWAKVAADPGAKDPNRLAELLRPLLKGMRRRAAAADASLQKARLIIDYASATPDTWMQDEATFGPRPARPGDVRLVEDSGQTGVRFIERGAAEYDRAFDVLRMAPEAEKDPGALGRMTPRAGRTLCTPTFKIAPGKIYYLVKGAGAAYASVCAHAIIEGPLHGQLVQNIPPSNDFRWLAHDLTRYQGLDAHLEFTAAPGADFAVAMVVQAEQPPDRLEPGNHALLKMLTPEPDSLEALAAAYRKLFTHAAKHLAADKTSYSADAGDWARLANWLAGHPQLLSDGAKTFFDTAAKLRAEEKQAAAGIQAESRLAPALLDISGMDEHVFRRGSPKAEGEPAPRRLLEALAGPRPLGISHGSGRLELARQITAPNVNPFLARVLVNRVWHHLFGRGLVASVDNLGVLGEPPTHPELLDYLADRFVKDGWSIKKLIRGLVLSNAYRMSSEPTPQTDAADPANLLLHRMRLRRLEGEAIRDAMLMVSGRLDRTLYGPSVPIYLTPFLDGRGRPGSGPLDGKGRRSLYLAVKRNFLSPLLLAFDTPAPFSTVGRRSVSNVPAQALILLNDPFVQEQAALWAKNVSSRPGPLPQRVTEMYLSAFARLPDENELKASEAFLKQQAELHGASIDDPKVWADLAHTLLNVKKFIFLN